jgi:sulfite reductase alpha subunit-like flavoprotein
MHLQLELGKSGMVVAEGDAVGVMPCNPPELVAHLCKRLDRAADAVLSLRPVDGDKVRGGCAVVEGIVV